MTKCPLLFLALLPQLLITGTGTAPAQENGPIRTTNEIRHLPRAKQKEIPAVELECVVLRLLNGNPLNLQVWQDGIAIYVNAAEAASQGVNVEPWRNFKPGDRVKLLGHVQEGHFAPTVYPTSIDLIAHGPVPEPRPIVASDFSSGVLDGQWVTVTSPR